MVARSPKSPPPGQDPAQGAAQGPSLPPPEVTEEARRLARHLRRIVRVAVLRRVLRARRLGDTLALYVAGAVAGVCAIVLAVACTFVGAAGAVAHLSGAPLWMGALVVGGTSLALFALGARVFWKRRVAQRLRAVRAALGPVGGGAL